LSLITFDFGKFKHFFIVREQGLGGALLESSLLNIVRLYREDRASEKRAVCGERKGFQSTAKTRKSKRVLLFVFGLHRGWFGCLFVRGHYHYYYHKSTERKFEREKHNYCDIVRNFEQRKD
jgi:hypothetical protein